jgi:hypothetical protein
VSVADERLKLLDTIVGRCIRDLDFGDRVLRDPEAALVSYDLDEDEMDDFRALARYADEARPRWQQIHDLFYRAAPAEGPT